jgi:hypothetical protein
VAISLKPLSIRATMRRLAQEGHSGRLVVGAGAAELCVWWLDGAPIAARAADEAVALLRRWERTGRVTPGVAALRAAATRGDVEALYALAPSVERARQRDERFLEVLARVSRAPTTPTFEVGRAPPHGDVLLDLDALAVLDRAAAIGDAARRTLAVGHLKAGSHADDGIAAAVARAAAEPTTVQALAERLDAEPWTALAWLDAWTERGWFTAVREDGPEPSSRHEAFSGSLDKQRGGDRSAFLLDAEDEDRLELTEDSTTDSHLSAPSTAATALGQAEIRRHLVAINVTIDALRRDLPTLDAGVALQRVQARPLLHGAKLDDAGHLPTDWVLQAARRSPRGLSQARSDLDAFLDALEGLLPADRGRWATLLASARRAPPR